MIPTLAVARLLRRRPAHFADGLLAKTRFLINCVVLGGEIDNCWLCKGILLRQDKDVLRTGFISSSGCP